MMQNAFNPWLPMRQAQQVDESTAQAMRDALMLKDREAVQRFGGKVGSGNYFAGYEGVPGAERPEAFKELWQTDPEQALKFEQAFNQEPAMQREILKAGGIQAAKKGADANAFAQMVRRIEAQDRPATQPQSMNAVFPSASSQPGATPAAMAAPYGTPSPELPTQAGVEKTIGMRSGEPFYERKQTAPGEFALKREATELDRRKTATGERTQEREAIQHAHQTVRNIREELRTTEQAIQNHDIPFAEGRTRLQELRGDLGIAAQQRDALLKGTPIGTPPEAPTVMPSRGQGPTAPPAPAATPPQSPLSEAAPPSSNAGLTEKDTAALMRKSREEQITAANKEVVNAREHAFKIQQYMPQVKELFDLVTKQDIGHPGLEGVPFSENVLNLNRANAQVHKLQGALTNMFAQPGQSQLMNTIVERTLQAATVPNLFAEPQLNKMNAANLRSNVEHLRNLPSFLERWQKAHNGTLDGAAETWIDYMEHNPIYTYSKDARGRVTVKENPHVTPVTEWMRGVRHIGKKTFLKQKDGSWTER